MRENKIVERQAGDLVGLRVDSSFGGGLMDNINHFTH